MFVSYCDLDDYYLVKELTHIITMAGVETRVRINQLEKGGLKLIKNNERDIREKSTFYNPNEMEQAYHFTFDNDNDIASHSNTETDEGKLKIIAGQSSGIMTSNALTLDDNVNYVEVRFNGNDDCDLCTFEVSFDNGHNYQTITPGTKGESGTMIQITNPGKNIRLRINMLSSAANAYPQIESAVVLFK